MQLHEVIAEVQRHPQQAACAGTVTTLTRSPR
jgi:hypothetical protein